MYFLPISSFPRNPVDFEGDYKYGLLTSVKGSLICSSISFKFHHQNSVLLSSLQFSRSVVSESLRPHGLQHSRPPCPSPTHRVYSNSCPSSQGCHPAISSSAIPFSSHIHSFPASRSFPVSQFFCIKWPKY